MKKAFNTSGSCRAGLHYMVDITSKLGQIKEMIGRGDYFTINRARQYGKTTTLRALKRFLEGEYAVISLDFQTMSTSKFRTENAFSTAFALDFLDEAAGIEELASLRETAVLRRAAENREEMELFELFRYLSRICGAAAKPVVLLIDEVDSASDNQIFLDFLAQLRGYYINRDVKPAFQSVILAGVYDVRNMKRKLQRNDGHKENSPWNIAADFLVDMSFSPDDIAKMLDDYEADYHTGMDTGFMAGLIYDYTFGYPFLVSRLCKLMDERVAGSQKFSDKCSAWTKTGFLEAVKLLLEEKNTLFESLANKISDYPELRAILEMLLFTGKTVPYNSLNQSQQMAEMFGFIKNADGTMVISNRIFEMVLYNLFLSEELLDSKVYDIGLQGKNQFLCGGHLNMRLVLEKFVIHFDELYGDQEEQFLEEAGRRYFLLYLKPIINGTGNYYIEAETRNRERTDIIIDYLGEQFIVEMKLWRGNAYNTRGEEQLSDYLDYYHLKKGYMLSFNFNKNKEIGIKEIILNDKVLIEAVV